jgi:hypothetical protein
MDFIGFGPFLPLHVHVQHGLQYVQIVLLYMSKENNPSLEKDEETDYLVSGGGIKMTF